MEVTKVEEGDLAHHTKQTFKRKVKWVTDQYGYRKQNTERVRHGAVVIGESNMVGCGSTQQDMFSEVLEEKLKMSVYPFAPAGIDTFLRSRRFSDNPPSIVILGSIERFIFDLEPVQISARKGGKFKKEIAVRMDGFKDRMRMNHFIQTFGILIDRFYKGNMLHYFRASLRRMISGSADTSKSIPSKNGPIFFLRGAEANRDVLPEMVDRTVHVLNTYHETFKSRGIRFIFLPIPEKENIYHEFLKTKKPLFLARLISELRKEGIETVDTQKAFDEAFQKGVLLYHTNDTHWNANAMRITADLMKEIIEKRD